MTTFPVELLTDQGNNAVLRLPGRKSPGVLVQGDSLFNLCALATAAVEGLDRGDMEVAVDAVREIAVELQDMRERYEAALRQHAIPLPYLATR